MPRSTAENLKILSQPDDSLWDEANKPLTDLPSEAADYVSDKINPNRETKGFRGISSAYIEALGHGVSDLTSPISLAMIGTGAVAKAASKAAPFARTVMNGVGAAQLLHGGKSMYEGYQEGDKSKMLGGAVESGIGYLGARSGGEPADTETKINADEKPDIKPSKPVIAPQTTEGVHTGSSSDLVENDPGARDNLRSATLNELRAYRSDPSSFEPKRAKALADNLSKRIATPNAISQAQEIYRSIKDPVYVSDVVRPSMGHGDVLAAEGEPEMSPSMRATLGTDTPERAPEVLPDTANAGDVGEIGTGKYFSPESPDVVPEKPTKKMFAKRTVNSGKGARSPKVKPKLFENVADPVPQAPTMGDVSDPTPQPSDPLPQVADPNRPFENSDIKNVQQLAKMGVQKAQDELTLRQKLMSEKGSAQIFPDSFNNFFSSKTKGPSASRPSLQEKDFTPRSKNLQAADEHSPGFASQFEDWVNARKAATIEGNLAKRKHTSLDEKGINGIFEFQDGNREGPYQAVQDYFDTKHQELTDKGVHAGFKENYLPQLWDNPADEVFEASKKLGLRPKFTLPSVLENYQKGLAIGLKPKFQNISDLVGWYEKTANKAIADRQFFDHLKENDLIRPKSKSPANGSWVSLDPDHFPIQKFQGAAKEYQGVLMAPKPVGDVVNNYLREPSGKVLGYVADKASIGKNLALSSGLPGTGINAHGFNIAARNVFSRGLLRGGAEAAKYLLSPSTANKELQANLDKAPFFMKHGLTLTTEGHEYGESSAQTLLKGTSGSDIPYFDKVSGKIDKGMKGLLEFHNKYFEKPLFQQIIPNLKLKHVTELYNDLKSQGLPDEAAAKSASQAINNIYGGINWEAFGRNRDTQNLWRALFLAPDWFETNYRIGKGMAQAMRNPNTAEGKIYGGIAKNILTSYVAANAANVATTGHAMWDNAPGHTLDVYAGKSGKQERWVRPFGTAADFIRLPIDEMTATMQGDLGQAFQIGKNRLSLPVRSGADLLENQNRFGKRIYNKDDFGRKIPMGKQALGIVDEVASPMMPQYVRNPIDLAAGNLNSEQAVVGSLEGPVRYSVGPKVKARSRTRSR